MKTGKVLIVDDEINITELISVNLEDNFNVVCCHDGLYAVELAKKELPDIILLDIMIPGIDGFEVCRRIRNDESTKKIPIIMLTIKREENDKVRGLKLGADDYITKPFGINELLARIDAVLRRVETVSAASISNDIIQIGDIEIDTNKYEVKKKGIVIELTLREFKLLQTLAKSKGELISREVLLNEVWGHGNLGDSRTLDVHIRKLRKKLEDNDKFPKYIETVRGLGYMIK